MNGGRETDGADLEAIDLEPAETRRPRRTTAPASGLPRRLGWSHRWPVVVAIAVVVALIGSSIVDRSRRTTPTTRAGETAIGIGSRPLFSMRVGAQLLFADDDGLQTVDTDTGRVRTLRIKGLPRGSRLAMVAESGGTVAVRVGTRLYWFTMRQRTAHPVDGTSAFPAGRSGYLWFAGDRSATVVPGDAKPIATSGPAVGATRVALLVPSAAGVMLQPAGSIGVADPPARLLLPAPATVIGVNPDRVAWVANECGVLRCTVHITEVAGGATSTWLQLTGRSSPLVAERASAVFSPDGASLAIVTPNERVTGAATVLVADLRSRATTVFNTLGHLDQGARPGSPGGSVACVVWTLDSRFLLLAPAVATGVGRVGLIDPAARRMMSSNESGFGSAMAAIGTSTAGPLDDPSPRPSGRIDSGGPTPFGTAGLGTSGLNLLGADEQQVDVIDLGTNRMSTWSLDGVAANPAGANSVARVTNGWLVARNGLVDLLTVVDGTARSELIDAGSQVFSSNHGRSAWIVIASSSAAWRVEQYDPATATVGLPITFSGPGPMAAVDAGLLVARFSEEQIATRLDLLDPDGRIHQGFDSLGSTFNEILAAAGNTVALRDEQGLYLYDVLTHSLRFITAQQVNVAAVSPDGNNVVWIDSQHGPASKIGLRAMRVGGSVVQIAAAADRVLVTDDGEVLFTEGDDVRLGRVDRDGSSPLYGLAPARGAKLAIG